MYHVGTSRFRAYIPPGGSWTCTEHAARARARRMTTRPPLDEHGTAPRRPGSVCCSTTSFRKRGRDGGLLRPSVIYDCTDSATWVSRSGRPIERRWIGHARFPPVRGHCGSSPGSTGFATPPRRGSTSCWVIVGARRCIAHARQSALLADRARARCLAVLRRERGGPRLTGGPAQRGRQSAALTELGEAMQAGEPGSVGVREPVLAKAQG
jgi:hypothetical protein